jgi:hypothetical protein
MITLFHDHQTGTSSKTPFMKIGPSTVLQEEEQGREALKAIGEMERAISTGLEQLRLIATEPHAAVAVDKTERHLTRGFEKLQKRLARQLNAKTWKKMARQAEFAVPLGGIQERMLSPWMCISEPEHDLALLENEVDFTSVGPHWVQWTKLQ